MGIGAGIGDPALGDAASPPQAGWQQRCRDSRLKTRVRRAHGSHASCLTAQHFAGFGQHVTGLGQHPPCEPTPLIAKSNTKLFIFPSSNGNGVELSLAPFGTLSVPWEPLMHLQLGGIMTGSARKSIQIARSNRPVLENRGDGTRAAYTTRFPTQAGGASSSPPCAVAPRTTDATRSGRSPGPPS